VNAGSGLKIEMFGQDVRHPIAHLDPEPFHLIPILALLNHRIPDRGIHSGIDMNPIGLYSGLEVGLAGAAAVGLMIEVEADWVTRVA
jgi:hypothetical protein